MPVGNTSEAFAGQKRRRSRGEYASSPLPLPPNWVIWRCFREIPPTRRFPDCRRHGRSAAVDIKLLRSTGPSTSAGVQFCRHTVHIPPGPWRALYSPVGSGGISFLMVTESSGGIDMRCRYSLATPRALAWALIHQTFGTGTGELPSIPLKPVASEVATAIAKTR